MSNPSRDRDWVLLGIYVCRVEDAPAPQLLRRQWLGRLRGVVRYRAVELGR